MADVTISQLSTGTPDKNTAVIPYSDGTTTLKASPAGIVAASPGSIIQVKQTVKTSVNICTSTINTYTEIDAGFRVSITPNNINNRFLHSISITGGSGTGTPRGVMQYSTDNGSNWTYVTPVSLNPTGIDGGSGDTTNGGSRQPTHFFTATLGDVNQLYTITFNLLQDTLTSSNTHIFRLLLGGDRETFFYWNRSANYANSFLGSRGISTWLVQEIAG